MKTVKLNAFNNPFVYGIENKEYLVFNIDNETQTLKFQSLISDLKVKTANILFKANSLPAKLYEMVVDDDILTFTLPSVLTGYNGSMYVYLLLNYSDDLSTSDLYTFKLVDKGSSTFNFEISSICESNISTIVSEEIKNEGIVKSVLDTVSNYEFDKLQHAQQSLSLVENAFSPTLEKRIDLFNSAYDKANATKSNTTGDINDSDIDIPSSNTDSDLKDYVENVKTQMSERLKDVTVVSQQIKDEMAQEKQSFLGSSLIFQQDLKQERDIISAYGESTRQHMDQEFNEVKDHADKVFADFSKEIPDLDASIKQVNDKIVATDNKVGTLNTKVTNVENDITELEKMHNEVTQTINNGKLISLYSNSLDFGDYDYSGNPNLLSNLSYDLIENQNTSAGTLSEGKNSFKYNKISAEVEGGVELYYKRRGIANWLPSNKTLVMTVKLRAGAGYSPVDGKKILIRYRFVDNGTGKIVLDLPINSNSITQEWKEFSITGTTPTFSPQAYHPWMQFRVQDGILGEIEMSYDIKIEEGSTATPYQPNLLDAPYYFSKVPLGENLITNAQFPIKTPNNPIAGFDISEELIIGETYTVSLKGTKPATKEFHLYYGEANYQQSQSQYQATLRPVEGLTDVWSATFTARNTSEMTNLLRVALWQKPNSATYGTVQIEWLKIEKGDTRTPNIESYKYKGVSLRNTIDPTAFDWQEQTVADVSTLKEQVNTLTPKVDNSQLFKLTKDDGNTIKVDYMSPKPTSFLALAKNTGFYSISTAESKLMSDYNELPPLLQNTFLFINNYPPRDGFIIQEITGGEISTQLLHKYYRRIEPDGTYKNWNKVITDKDVSKMKTLYSNSTDFGDYDYSGNPNLMANINANNFSQGTGVLSVVDDGDEIVFTLDPNNKLDSFKAESQPALLVGKTYTMSAEIMLENDFTGDPSKISLRYIKMPNWLSALTTRFTLTNDKGVWQKITVTDTMTTAINNAESWFIMLHNRDVNNKLSGKVRLRNIKIEEGSTATPYQPNLLDAPYYLSKAALVKNIADPTKTFPITSSETKLYTCEMTEPFVIGETYTITLKGTKPADKKFRVYNEGVSGYAHLSPVEGLTDVWSATFTVNELGPVHTRLNILQVPTDNPGNCTIDWLKIEKGETFTPNIERFEYKGISSIETSPNNYYWSAEPFNRSIYSNSVDFGKWDYTGNPNLSANLDASCFSDGTGGTAVDDNDEIVFTLDGTTLTKYKVGTQTPLVHGKTYTISCEILLESDFVGDPSNIKLQHSFLPGGQVVLQTTTIPSNTLGVWQKLQGTTTINYGSGKPSQWYSVFTNLSVNTITGHIRLRNVKIEEARKATPYQPNLLVAPYYLSKVALGENIADPKKVFPVSSTGSEIYSGTMTEPFIVGQTYTVTLEGTKPEHKNFTLFNPGVASYGNFLPVEGLVNVWSLTFTVGGVASNPNIAAINQVPAENPGSCQINWVKIEKSSVATPNIKEYKYKGFSVKPSNNPNDYEWSIDRQYGEKRLDKMVNTTDPQSIDGTKNFLETPLVKGKEVLYGDRLFEGFYGSGTVHSNFKTKTRLGVGGLVMDDQPRLPEPFEWNSGRWQATVIRDVTFYCEGTMYIDTGANMGKYIYIANWKDDAQTQYASGNPAGMGIAADNGYWYRNLKDFSWIMSLKKGDKFSIGIELAADKEVGNIQIRTLHIKELIPPLE